MRTRLEAAEKVLDVLGVGALKLLNASCCLGGITGLDEATMLVTAVGVAVAARGEVVMTVAVASRAGVAVLAVSAAAWEVSWRSNTATVVCRPSKRNRGQGRVVSLCGAVMGVEGRAAVSTALA